MRETIQLLKDHILLKLYEPPDFDYIEYSYKIYSLKMITRNL